MADACKSIAEELRQCIIEHDDDFQQGKPLGECYKAIDVGHECMPLKTAYFECRRGRLDMRQRIQGRKGFRE